jgi:hypothetical protein
MVSRARGVAALPNWRVDPSRALSDPRVVHRGGWRPAAWRAHSDQPALQVAAKQAASQADRQRMAAVERTEKRTRFSEPEPGTGAPAGGENGVRESAWGRDAQARRRSRRRDGATFGLVLPLAERASLASSWCIIPRSDKAAQDSLGEDAVFVAENAIGCADGVGQWAKHGVDAGVFARHFMEQCASAAQLAQAGFEGPTSSALQIDSLPPLDPLHLMARSASHRAPPPAR